MAFTTASSAARFPRRPNRASLKGLFTLARQRRQLARLDDDQLRDIGVTRSEAQAEAARPLWDAPATWSK